MYRCIYQGVTTKISMCWCLETIAKMNGLCSYSVLQVIPIACTKQRQLISTEYHMITDRNSSFVKPKHCFGLTKLLFLSLLLISLLYSSIFIALSHFYQCECLGSVEFTSTFLRILHSCMGRRWHHIRELYFHSWISKLCHS